MANNDNKDSNLLLGLVLGVCTGALVAMLNAPKSGKELQEDIKQQSEEIPREFSGLISEVQDFYTSITKLLKVISAEQGQRLGKAVQEAEKAFKTTLKE